MDSKQSGPYNQQSYPAPASQQWAQQPAQDMASSQYQSAGTVAPIDTSGQIASAQQYPPPPVPPRSYAPPPQRVKASFGDDDPSNPIHYTRDPHKLVAYLIPFPKPRLAAVDPSTIPERFLIYTPPPPPLTKPAEGEKESKVHKLQRKWQEEVREAKTSTAKTASWKGVKSKVTRGINTAMGYTKSASLEFLTRVPGDHDNHAEHDANETDTTHRTVGLEEMILIYPPSYNASPDQMRAEFVNTMLRSKSKAQKDAVIATGLLPVSAAIDILATVIWPFGGLLEVDGVWAYSSIRGAKTARSVTKRLTSSMSGNHSHDSEELSEDKLKLSFTASQRLEVLHRYLGARCAEHDAKLFPSAGVPPTETEVLQAIGWEPSQSAGATQNWEDEQWETIEVKDDLKNVMHKGAREWDKWCKKFAEDPDKALKK